MHRLGTTRLRWLLVSLATFAAAVFVSTRGINQAAAQARYQTLGPSECVNCHDHQDERTWYEKKEMPEVRKLFPDRGAQAGHINSLKQLDDKKGDPWAAAIGVKDKYDAKSPCVRCHATVFQGEANSGVSCESCHGPSSGYLKPHQTKGAYDQSVALGMTKLVGNLQAWADQCTTCHVMDDARLVKAGHPSGNDFDLGAKFQPVALHFKKKYSAGDISAIGRAQVQAILRRRDGSAPPAVTVAPPPAPPAPTAPAGPTPTAPPITSAPPATTPSVVTPPPPPPTANVAPVERRGATPPPGPPVAAPEPVVTPRQQDPPVAAVPAPAVSAPAARAAAAGTAPATGSASAAVALAQGQLIVELTDLLQRGAAAPLTIKSRSPLASKYAGPDAALLQLQADAIALALEAFGTAPVQPVRAAAPARPR